MMVTVTGPLKGVKILEIEGMGGAPFAGMLLADLGADIIRVERPAANPDAITGTDPGPVLGRGRAATIRLDLKSEAGRAALFDLLARADVMMEAFRPGVAERLGFGPEIVLEQFPRLIYARLTGWGRTGPLARTAGHDINFIAMAGLLGAIGRPPDPPVPPLAIGGDMGGGGLFLALGILSALLEREKSGIGQVVDAAMVDGAALLVSAFWAYYGKGEWSAERGTNVTDGGAPFYTTYRCKDNRFVAVGALEPRFFRQLCELVGIPYTPDLQDRANWPALHARLSAIFLTQTQKEWCDLAGTRDACLSPVLDFSTAPGHPQNVERGVFTQLDGLVQPAPGPHFSRTPLSPRAAARDPLQRVLADWGASAATVDTVTGSE